MLGVTGRQPNDLAHEVTIELSRCLLCDGTRLAPDAIARKPNQLHSTRSRCGDCGLIFANPQATDAEIRSYYSRYYDRGNFDGWKCSVLQWRDGYAREQRQARAREVVRAFRRLTAHIPVAGQRWLEMGAGLGQLSYLAQRAGAQVTVTDFDHDAVGFMRQHMGLVDAHVGDLLTLDFAAGSYDIVVINHVLEHVRNPLAVLHAAHDVLVPGGFLYVGVPNVGATGYGAHRLITAARRRPPVIVDGAEHTLGFTKATLTRALNLTGFRVLHHEHRGVGTQMSELWQVMREHGPRKALLRVAETTLRVKQEVVASRRR